MALKGTAPLGHRVGWMPPAKKTPAKKRRFEDLPLDGKLRVILENAEGKYDELKEQL